MPSAKLVGVLVDNIGLSQQTFYMVNHINMLCKTSNEFDFVVFFKNLMPPAMRPFCACLYANEIWNFNGTLISTDLDSALSCLNAVNRAENILYLWDLEWLRGSQRNYIQNIAILRNPDLKLVARSVDHAKAIENYANRKVDKIVDDFNINEILQ